MHNAEEKAKKVGCTYINPTPYTQILHPILHPKSSVNTGHPAPWCRKCMRFSKTFFCREGGKGECDVAVQKVQNIGLLWYKVRMFCLKSTDVLPQKYGCFHRKDFGFNQRESFREHRHHCPNTHHKQGLSSSPRHGCPTVDQNLEFGVVDAGTAHPRWVPLFSHGYLIFQQSQRYHKGLNTGRGILP